jgi:hypothetical protein
VDVDVVVDFLAVDDEADVFLAGDFFAAVVAAADFLAGDFLAGDFFAGVVDEDEDAFLAGDVDDDVFFADEVELAFLVVDEDAFLAGDFFAVEVDDVLADFVAGAFLAVLLAGVLLAGVILAGAFLAALLLADALPAAALPEPGVARLAADTAVPAAPTATARTDGGFGIVAAVSLGSFLAPDTTFLRSWPGENLGTAFFLDFIRSPVWGLRTQRALRTAFSKDPKPVMATFSPLATSRVMVSSTESSACAACLRFPS